MDATGFEARLRQEGYPEIRTNQMPVEGDARPYRAGEELSMKADFPHAEDVGSSGVKYLVGRRPVR